MAWLAFCVPLLLAGCLTTSGPDPADTICRGGYDAYSRGQAAAAPSRTSYRGPTYEVEFLHMPHSNASTRYIQVWINASVMHERGELQAVSPDESVVPDGTGWLQPVDAPPWCPGRHDLPVRLIGNGTGLLVVDILTPPLQWVPLPVHTLVILLHPDGRDEVIPPPGPPAFVGRWFRASDPQGWLSTHGAADGRIELIQQFPSTPGHDARRVSVHALEGAFRPSDGDTWQDDPGFYRTGYRVLAPATGGGRIGVEVADHVPEGPGGPEATVTRCGILDLRTDDGVGGNATVAVQDGPCPKA